MTLKFGFQMPTLWQNMYAFEQICFAVNGQILINNPAIWSRWTLTKLYTKCIF